MSTFDEYRDRYENYRFERTPEGILTMTMHTEGSDLVWGMKPDDELGKAFVDIASDPDNQVVVLTGTGDTFIHHEDLGADVDVLPAEMWGGYILPYVIRLIHNHLDIVWERHPARLGAQWGGTLVQHRLRLIRRQSA
jgi:hypothetical protein